MLLNLEAVIARDFFMLVFPDESEVGYFRKSIFFYFYRLENI